MARIAVLIKPQFLTAFVLLGAWCLVVTGVSEAQVVIEERVEIEASTSEIDSTAKSETIVFSLIPEYDGELLVYYANGSKFTSAIFGNAVVHVFGDQLESVTDSLFPRKRLEFSYSASINSNCTPFSGTEYHYVSGDSAIWNIGHVDKGDQIQFSYDGQDSFVYGTWYEQNVPPEAGPPWEITLGSYNCFSPVVWNEFVWLNAVVTRDSLTIEIDDPKEVWPSIPASGWQSEILDEVESVLSPITVTVTANGSPVASQEVELAVVWVDTSGGHVHAQPAVPTASPPIPKGIPHLNGSSLGSLGLLTGTLVSSTDSTVVATTDQYGEISVSYTAGEFAGQVAFIASTTMGAVDVIDADTVVVKVPNLTMLPDVPQTEYKKLGGTLNHPGPDDNHFGNDFLHDPDYNHWIRADVLPKIQEIAAAWLDTEGEVLWVNDMSLVNGGDFDISGTWTGTHKQHRVGRDADIKTTKSSNGDGVHVSQEVLEDGSPAVYQTGDDIGNSTFEEIINQNCGVPEAEFDDGHYHIRFYPDSMNDCD